MEKVKKVLVLISVLMLISCSFLGLLGSPVLAANQTISTDINGINEQQYPGIKERINMLKVQYPNWNFKILYTGLDWNEVISNEYVGHNSGPRNQVQATTNYQGAWICSACGYKNGLWRCASEAAIQYMMDPRNSLNASDIFQFEELTNNGYDMNVIQNMINGTFLSRYAQIFANAANSTGVNPYYIIARLIQEQGSGTSPLVTGSRGYYNPFNIQATGNSDEEVINNGINYAAKQEWNTLEKGIIGGINFLSSEYTKKGQNTLYLQKFDVESNYNGLYWHQYMQNIMAAQGEGTTLRKTYEKINSVSSSHTFIIPVYNNMPRSACARPNGSSSAPVTGDIVKLNVNSTINLRNAPNGKVIGSLKKDEIVTRIEKATQRNGKTYWDKVRKADGTVGYVARETDYDESPYKLYLVPVGGESNTPTPTPPAVTPPTTPATPPATTPTTGNQSGEVTLGDIDGDNRIDAMDMYKMIQYILGNMNFSTQQFSASDFDKNGKIDAMDMYLLIQKINNK